MTDANVAPLRRRLRALKRTIGFALSLILLSVAVPDSSRVEAQYALVELGGVHGVDATDDVVWILALGSDARPGEPVLASRSDAIQLVGIDASTRSAVTIGVPRDAYVDIPGYGSDKINAAMTYGGPATTAETINALTGITPDYVFVTSFRGLIHMVGKINGIRAKVTFEMADQGVSFSPGMHKFTGGEALKFARIRYGLPRGDFDRSYDQGQLLKGGLATVLGKLGRPGFFERAMSHFARYTDTNLNPVQLYRLGRTVLEVNPARVRVCVLDGDLGFVGAASVVFLDRAAVSALSDDVRHDAQVQGGC
jgi:LCP family protein required for cell wall assembly